MFFRLDNLQTTYQLKENLKEFSPTLATQREYEKFKQEIDLFFSSYYLEDHLFESLNNELKELYKTKFTRDLSRKRKVVTTQVLQNKKNRTDNTAATRKKYKVPCKTERAEKTKKIARKASSYSAISICPILLVFNFFLNFNYTCFFIRMFFRQKRTFRRSV